SGPRRTAKRSWMFMDKIALELITLLREMLEAQRRLLAIAMGRRQAMQAYEMERLHAFAEQEKAETERSAQLEKKRTDLAVGFRQETLRMGQGNVPFSVSEIAKRCQEPAKSQLLVLAAELKSVVEQVERHMRINAKISDAVVKGISRVLKVVTGMAQHAGLYMRNGRKAAVAGIHLLEVTA
ncbi:MAG TPA: flagellar export chaperone FlgN, partial [Bryobacteraceae bacterium]|nr:flagellar export chaperone FlgN [Bryobacteraceae bacterium]